MSFNDEKDYVMRMIKEMVKVLFSLLLGKKYVQVELPEENKYEISGSSLAELKAMVDAGEINEAENIVMGDLDFSNKDEVAAAVYFYKYVSEKSREFLERNDYSMEEVLEGLKWIADKSGYGAVCDTILDQPQ